jgi:chaperonin GroEL
MRERGPRRPALVFQPYTYHSLEKGADQLVGALRPTLGPFPRAVAIARHLSAGPPEILDDGATIARRIIELPDRAANVGAMLLRNALWKMHEDVGDGTTTMAVMFQSILNQGIHYITAGCADAMRLRLELDRSVSAASATLRAGPIPLTKREDIAKMALALSCDEELASALGEICYVVGIEGYVHVETGHRRRLEREYVEGTYWENSGWFSSLMETDPVRHRAVLNDVAILISDVSVHDAGELVPVLSKVVQARIPNLVVIASDMSDNPIGLLMQNRQAGIAGTLGVRAPMLGSIDQATLEDMAALTGGRFICRTAGESLETLRLEDLGRARQVWATDTCFGIVAGKGDPRHIRRRIATLRALIKKSEGKAKDSLRHRLGRLLGGSAVLRVGGVTNIEVDGRKATAEKAIRALQVAMEGGLVPGGGTALLSCQTAVAATPARDRDEIIARRILSRALEEPLRVIAANAGYAPGTIVARVRAAPPGYGLDVRTGQIVDMREAGILDAVTVLDGALRIAASSAAVALTTDTIVLRKRPPESIEP